jgi:hypothetical protein
VVARFVISTLNENSSALARDDASIPTEVIDAFAAGVTSTGRAVTTISAVILATADTAEAWKSE